MLTVRVRHGTRGQGLAASGSGRGGMARKWLASSLISVAAWRSHRRPSGPRAAGRPKPRCRRPGASGRTPAALGRVIVGHLAVDRQDAEFYRGPVVGPDLRRVVHLVALGRELDDDVGTWPGPWRAVRPARRSGSWPASWRPPRRSGTRLPPPAGAGSGRSGTCPRCS